MTSLQVAQLHGSDAQGPSVDADGFLTWPVLLAYPEHRQTDFVEAFHEASCLQDHLQVGRLSCVVVMCGCHMWLSCVVVMCGCHVWLSCVVVMCGSHTNVVVKRGLSLT
jgi:hypothetical protein